MVLMDRNRQKTKEYLRILRGGIIGLIEGGAIN